MSSVIVGTMVAHKVCRAVFLDKSGIPSPRLALLIRYRLVKREDWLKSIEAILPCRAVYSMSSVVRLVLESMSTGKSPATKQSLSNHIAHMIVWMAGSLGTELLPIRRNEDKDTIFANVVNSCVGTFGYFNSLTLDELRILNGETQAAHRSVSLPRASQVTPCHPHGLAFPAQPPLFSPSPWVPLYTSITAQNWSAAPTPVELPSTRGPLKSFVADIKMGTQSEHG